MSIHFVCGTLLWSYVVDWLVYSAASWFVAKSHCSIRWLIHLEHPKSWFNLGLVRVEQL